MSAYPYGNHTINTLLLIILLYNHLRAKGCKSILQDQVHFTVWRLSPHHVLHPAVLTGSSRAQNEVLHFSKNHRLFFCISTVLIILPTHLIYCSLFILSPCFLNQTFRHIPQYSTTILRETSVIKKKIRLFGKYASIFFFLSLLGKSIALSIMKLYYTK